MVSFFLLRCPFLLLRCQDLCLALLRGNIEGILKSLFRWFLSITSFRGTAAVDGFVPNMLCSICRPPDLASLAMNDLLGRCFDVLQVAAFPHPDDDEDDDDDDFEDDFDHDDDEDDDEDEDEDDGDAVGYS